MTGRLLDARVARLRQLLVEFDRAVVCFSGGVDSGYLLAEAVGVLGDRALALTAVSPSLAPEEGAAARALAEQLGARHLLVETAEVDDPRYAANPVNRCYFCKTEVYGRAVPHVIDGVDDRGDVRPGRQAARELGVRSPLDEIGFTKAIREAARRIELPIWNKPALACLSSRFPYGTTITPEPSRRSPTANASCASKASASAGCGTGEVARIEVAPEEVQRLTGDAALLLDVTAGFRASRGGRSGRLPRRRDANSSRWRSGQLASNNRRIRANRAISPTAASGPGRKRSAPTAFMKTT